MGAADHTVEIYVDDSPASTGNPVPVTGSVSTGGVTDAELRATPLPVSLGADEDHLGAVGGSLAVVGAEVVRPAGNATPYTAKDVVGDGTVTELALLARVNEGTGYIVKARVMTDKNDVTPRLRLHLFHTAPSAIADNAPYTLLYANADKRIGHIDLPAMGTEGTGSDASFASVLDARVAFKCAAGSRSVFVVIETLDAFTPNAGQKFFVQLAADQN